MKRLFIKVVKKYGLKYDLTPCNIDGTEFKNEETQKAFLAVHYTIEPTKRRYNFKVFFTIFFGIELLATLILILGVFK